MDDKCPDPNDDPYMIVCEKSFLSVKLQSAKMQIEELKKSDWNKQQQLLDLALDSDHPGVQEKLEELLVILALVYGHELDD